MALTTDAPVRAETIEKILGLDGFATGRSVDLLDQRIAASSVARVRSTPHSRVLALLGQGKSTSLVRCERWC